MRTCPVAALCDALSFGACRASSRGCSVAASCDAMSKACFKPHAQGTRLSALGLVRVGQATWDFMSRVTLDQLKTHSSITSSHQDLEGLIAHGLRVWDGRANCS